MYSPKEPYPDQNQDPAPGETPQPVSPLPAENPQVTRQIAFLQGREHPKSHHTRERGISICIVHL